jgi:hypothetical protein
VQDRESSGYWALISERDHPNGASFTSRECHGPQRCLVIRECACRCIRLPYNQLRSDWRGSFRSDYHGSRLVLSTRSGLISYRNQPWRHLRHYPMSQQPNVRHISLKRIFHNWHPYLFDSALSPERCYTACLCFNIVSSMPVVTKRSLA